jgi:hypothetical protein
MIKIRRTRAGLRIRQRNHAMKRCKERYGIELTLKDYIHLCDRVWTFADGLEDSDRLGVYAVTGFREPKFFVWFRGIIMLVSWSIRTQQINTSLNTRDWTADRDLIIELRQTPMSFRWKVERELRLKHSIGVSGAIV